MIKTRIEEKSNYRAIWCNGKTVRFAIDTTKPIIELEYPEFYDIKITGNCNGKCPYCYMNSKPEQHYENIIEKTRNFFKDMTPNQLPFQVACLEENTLIYGKNGATRIGDLKIGDYIFNDIGELVEVVNVTKSLRETISLKGNKGFFVISTPDHPFKIDDGSIVNAENLLNKKLSISKFQTNNNIITIDLSRYSNKSSRIKNKRCGSSGGIVTKDKVAFMHTLSPIKRYLTLTEDVMWLYGLSVAEGSRRGLSLHKKEKHYADKALEIYYQITGLNNSNIREIKNTNSLNVEFQESKTYSTIFFNAMKIGYGSRNKTIKFLYGLPKNLIKSALIGMFDGDGCYRTKFDKRNKKKYFSLSYKTTSKILANELIHILSCYFDVKASIYEGLSPIRKIEGRVLEPSNYFMVNIYGNDNINKLFSEMYTHNMDFNIVNTTKYSVKKIEDYIEINEIIASGIKNVVDITLSKNSSHLFTISHGVITHNCGGGEPTSHPDFMELLRVLKEEFDICPNYTTNGMWVKESHDFKIDLIRSTEKYCGGVAVSCHPHLIDYWVKASNLYSEFNIKLNFHIIISDKNSIDYFKDIYHNWKDIVEYFVLLPYGNQGRAEQKEIDWGYLVKNLPEDQSKLAFGANFYPYLLKKDHGIKVALYEPEIMSKFLDLKDMKIYPSSFTI